MTEQSLILAERVRSHRDRDLGYDLLTFVSSGEDGTFHEETRNYGELWRNGQRLAAWMQSQGMRKGDRFAPHEREQTMFAKQTSGTFAHIMALPSALIGTGGAGIIGLSDGFISGCHISIS